MGKQVSSGGQEQEPIEPMMPSPDIDPDTIARDWEKYVVPGAATFFVGVLAVAGYELRKYARKRHEQEDL